jgi:hypothetical protein
VAIALDTSISQSHPQGRTIEKPPHTPPHQCHFSGRRKVFYLKSGTCVTCGSAQQYQPPAAKAWLLPRPLLRHHTAFFLTRRLSTTTGNVGAGKRKPTLLISRPKYSNFNIKTAKNVESNSQQLRVKIFLNFLH